MAIAVPPVPSGDGGRTPFVGAPVSPMRDNWKFAVGSWGGLPDTELSRITSRTVTWRLLDNHEASFTIDATLPEAAGISELISGLWVLRNGKELYRGLIGPSSDTADADSHTTQFSSADFRAVLSRRLIYDHDSLIVDSVDEAQVAWNLINVSQGRPGGDLGIIQGIGRTTGVTISPQFTPGAFVGEQINTLAASANGFDWDITPIDGTSDLSFDVWYPQRGYDRQTILDFPGRLQGFTRNVDPGAYANAIRASGGDGLPAIAADSATVTSDPTPRLEALLSDTDIATRSGLADWATGQLGTASTVTPSWTVTLAPNAWGGPSDFWLGDPVSLIVKSGRLDVAETLRVFEIALSLDDNSDAATVQVTLGAPPPSRRWLLRAFDKRISKLSKR